MPRERYNDSCKKRMLTFMSRWSSCHGVNNIPRVLLAETTGVIPKSLPVLLTEPVPRKDAVDREIRLSTDQ